MSPEPDRLLALVETLLAADTLEAAASGTARELAAALEAASAGVVILIHGRVFLEAWEPAEPRRSRVPLQSLRAIAVQTAQNGTAACMPLDDPAGAPLLAQAIHLPLSQRLRGALCIVSPQVDGAAPVPLDRLARLLALRLSELLDLQAERRKSQQFERWFRVSDRQIRALDLERQKFAALVSSFGGGAFVANREGVITWQSRPLLEPPGEAGPTWVGRSCHEFCRAVGGGTEACGACLIERVLTTRQPAACDMPVAGPGSSRVAHVAAAPINDLAGRAQEVIVTFHDAPPLERAA